jgi:RecQ family ATP-dependent DNA helicase
MSFHEKYNKIVKRKFGYSSLKPQQFDIINKIINEQCDVVGILATGFGKSLCYQMPYLITKKSVIVVSPLIALMNDQMIELQKINIPCTVLNSTCTNKKEVMNEILGGENRIIYITPEYIEYCEQFIKLLVENEQLCLVAIDEAHCVSTWGLDFRKSYTQLYKIKEWLSTNTEGEFIESNIPLLAVTATASSKVQKDMIKMLKLENPYVVVGDFDRTNLYISVKKKTKNAYDDLYNLLNKYKNEYIIIYCKTRDDTEKLSDVINEWNIKSLPYHAGISSNKKNETQQKFIDGEIKCIIATIAFGMGINIKNVRMVIHYNCPKNMESYYQEFGRAGRDGLYSECYLFYSKKDFILNNLFLKEIKDPVHKLYQQEQINMIERYVVSNICRRTLILKSFDSTYNKNKCENCDICINSTNNIVEIKKDFTIPTLIILRLINKLNGKYGCNTYINILRGSNAKNVFQSMKTLKLYNVGKVNSVEWWKELIDKLIQEKYIEETKISFGSTLKCSKLGIQLINKINTKYTKVRQLYDNIKFDDNDKILLVSNKILNNDNGKVLSWDNSDNTQVKYNIL